MYTKAKNAKNNNMSRAAANSVARKKNKVRKKIGIVENRQRQESVEQKSLQMMMNNSSRRGGTTLARPPLRPPLRPLPLIQLIKRTGYWSRDSWVGTFGGWKTGAGEKWKHLEKLYEQARSALQGMTETGQFERELDEIDETEIGFSEYKTKMVKLVDINRGIDLARFEQAGAGNERLMQTLKKYADQENDFTKHDRIEFPSGGEMMKALILKIYTTEIGRTTCNGIMVLLAQQKHGLRLGIGDNSESQFNSDQSTIIIKIDGDKYASGESGEIIVNSAEITLIHELGHCLHNLEARDRERRRREASEYQTLEREEQKLWDEEEEYENITKVENEYRRELGLPLRKYHATDLVRQRGTQWVQAIRAKEDVINYLNITDIINGKEGLFDVEERAMIEGLWALVRQDEDTQDDRTRADIRRTIRMYEPLLTRLAAIETRRLSMREIERTRLAVRKISGSKEYLLDLGYPSTTQFV